MPTFQDLLLGAGLPFLVAAFLLPLAGGNRLEGDEPRSAPWLRAVGLMVAFGAGYLALFGWPPWPPAEGWQWLPLLAGALAFSALLECLLARELLWLPRLAVALATVRLALGPWLEYQATGEEMLWWPVGVAVAWTGAATAVDALAARRPGVTWPLLLAVTGGAAAVVLLDAGSARLAQAEGVLAAACGGGVLAAWFRRGFHLGRGPAAAAMGLHAALLLNGHFFLENLPLAPAVLLLAAPLAGVLGEAPAFRERRLASLVLRLVAVAILPAVALYMVRSGQPAAA